MGSLISVPARVIAALALALAGAWTVGALVFTIALFAMAALLIVWAVIETAGEDK